MRIRVVDAGPALSASHVKAVVNPIHLPGRCLTLLAALPACAAIRPDLLDCPGDPSVAVSFR